MKPVKIESLFDVHFLSDVKLSPDGKHAAFVQSKGVLDENKYNSFIWIYDFENSGLKKLTSAGGERNFFWLDNETVAFSSARDEKDKEKIAKGWPMTVYYKINLSGGEADKLFTVPLKANEVQKLDSGEFLVSALYDNYGPDFLALDDAGKEKALKEMAEANAAYKIFDEIPFWQNAQGVTNKKRKRLYIFNPDTGEVKPISPALMNVSSTSIKDGLLAYTGVDFENKMVQITPLTVYNLKTGESKVLDLGETYNIHNVEIARDKILITGVKTAEANSYRNPEMYMVSLSGGKPEPFVNLDVSFGGGIGSDCKYGGGKAFVTRGDDFYYLSARGYNSYLFKLSKDGVETKVSPDVYGSIDAFDIACSNTAYVAVRDKGLQEVYTLDLSTGEEKRITDFNKAWLEEHTVSYPEHFTMVNRDGTELDCFIIKPVGYEAGKKYPGILDMHGGPKAIYGESLFHEMQVWANEGYFVFFTNPRGSDGKGSEFANIIGERYVNWDYNDFMDFTDKVLELYPDIDMNNIGVTGGSYGGLMTNWIVGHTNRFKAAAAQRSISNFVSKCLTTDIGYYHNLNQMGTDPWTDESVFWDKSPLKYADKCKTPLLFIQSDNDYRCWMGDAIQMFTALKMHGCDSRMCLIHGENHELSRSGKPKNRYKRIEEMTNWFNKYLK